MEFFVLKKFCCCCTVRTGTITIIAIEIVVLFFLEISRQIKYFLGDNQDDKSGTSDFNILFPIMDLIGAILAIITCFLVLYGIDKNNRKCFLPWLILNMFGNVTFLILIFLILILFSPELILVAAVLFIITLLSIYLWLCVWSYYKQLGEPVEQIVEQPRENISIA